MTTYVCVMYVFDKHVHALNLFVISTLTVDFSYHVRVWHLILKKNCISLTGNKKATFFLQLNQREIQQLTIILTFPMNLYAENFLRNICKLKNHFVTLQTQFERKGT